MGRTPHEVPQSRVDVPNGRCSDWARHARISSALGPVASCRLVTEGLGIRHLRLVLGPTSWTVLARGMGGEEEPHPIKTPSANDQYDLRPRPITASCELAKTADIRGYRRTNIPPYQTDIIVFFTTFSFDPRAFPRISVAAACGFALTL